MKASRFRLALDAASRATGFAVYTKTMLARAILAGESPRACEKTLAAAVADGVLVRLCRGIYVYRYALHGQAVLQEAVLRMRPGVFSYLSLESALSSWGVISQEAQGGVTVMTGGRSQRFATPFGGIELTHTSKRFDTIWPQVVPPAGPLEFLPTAKPRLAARDLLRVGRNTDLIDWVELAEVEREQAT